MKKLLLLSALSFVALFASVGNADAWFLNCCNHWGCNHWCGHRCTTTVNLRPYNAFSPCCYGNINADGCCPINMCGGGFCGPQNCQPSCFGHGLFGCLQNRSQPNFQPNCYQPNCYQPNCGPYGCPSYGPGCCDFGGCLPSPGALVGSGPTPLQIPAPQGQPAPQINPGQQMVVPNPQMLNQGAYMTPMQVPMQAPMQMVPNYGYAPIQPSSYNVGYQPAYNPYGYGMMPVNYGQFQSPNYWYGR